MGAAVTNHQGAPTTRLQFLQCQLAGLLDDQLALRAQFSVVVFADGVRTFSGGLVPASRGNIGRAAGWLHQQRPGGRTNLHAALQAAFAVKPEAVYWLTDRTPTAGAVTRANERATLARSYSEGRVPVQTVAFTMGHDSGDNAAASRSLMRQPAEQTGGIYRAVEDGCALGLAGRG